MGGGVATDYLLWAIGEEVEGGAAQVRHVSSDVPVSAMMAVCNAIHRALRQTGVSLLHQRSMHPGID